MEIRAPLFLDKIAENNSKRATSVEVRVELENIDPLSPGWVWSTFDGEILPN